jgi:hypothetical protein
LHLKTAPAGLRKQAKQEKLALTSLYIDSDGEVRTFKKIPAYAGMT